MTEEFCAECIVFTQALLLLSYFAITSRRTIVDSITRIFVRAREWHRGQTMTEYALILSAVAVIVYLGYQTMGSTITSLLGTVDGSL